MRFAFFSTVINYWGRKIYETEKTHNFFVDHNISELYEFECYESTSIELHSCC